jgi:hypothetical protein
VRVFEVRFHEASLIDGEAFVVLEVRRLADNLGIDDCGPALDLRRPAEQLYEVSALIGAHGLLTWKGKVMPARPVRPVVLGAESVVDGGVGVDRVL